VNSPRYTADDRELADLWAEMEAKSGVALPPPLRSLCIDGIDALQRGFRANSALPARAMRSADEASIDEVVRWLAEYRLLDAKPDRHSTPLFIVAFSRTGSTMLHELLALDEANRTPKLWELWHPGSVGKAGADAAREQTRRRLARMRQAAPGVMAAHPMREDGPEECAWIVWHNHTLAPRFLSRQYWDWFSALTAASRDVLLDVYGRYVALMMSGAAPRRWVGKGQAHLHHLPALLRLFPQARIVRLHRDPHSALPSMSNLYAAMWKSAGVSPAEGELSGLVVDLFAHGVRQFIASDDPALGDRVLDVSFDDLTGHPVSTVRRIYDRFGYDWTPALERRIETFVGTSVSAGSGTVAASSLPLARCAALGDYEAWLWDRAKIAWRSR
jgi:hypothetical protein